VGLRRHGLGRTAKDVALREVRTDYADGYVPIASLRWPWRLEQQSLGRHRVSSVMLSSRNLRGADVLWICTICMRTIGN
jgi:hypothetical protein